ncbi:hypothetical protein NDU88_005197 [Pleurodeles waltl]|uniref:Uncharacterized protein n=1 Tax=Pleurodeles waltl TaxID=8319 RepID=A0AAV7NN94_PLEWA|nr:hypothetical protein NDU88_005197 [Pleurodeles waltl]
MRSGSLLLLPEGNVWFVLPDANWGQLQTRIQKTVRVSFLYYRRLAFGIYHNSAAALQKAKKVKMPPKGAKNVTLSGRGKPPNPVSLETIYQSIMEHREESKSESRRTQLACRKMQIQIRRVGKTCSEFTTRMEEVETRISHLEDEAGSQQVT